MVYTSKKPYQTPSKDYVRFLKQNIGPESVFEKPYAQPEYGEMNQAPNTPDIPPDPGGTGGLSCLYNSTECEVLVGCYAGPGIKIDGGPEEADAGYEDPTIIEGALIGWEVGDDARGITITLDPSVSRNVIEVGFLDGWGERHVETVDVTCQVAEPEPEPGDTFYLGDYYSDTGTKTQPDGAADSFSSGFFRVGKTIAAGYDISYDTYVRFEDVTVAQGTSITSATLTLTRDYGDSTKTIVQGHDVDDASQVTTLAQFNAAIVNLTTASLSQEHDSANPQAKTFNVTSIVQEILNRGSWASGNHIAFYLFDDVASYAVNAFIEFISTDTSSRPVLNIVV